MGDGNRPAQEQSRRFSIDPLLALSQGAEKLTLTSPKKTKTLESENPIDATRKLC